MSIWLQIGILLVAGFYARWFWTVATDRCTAEEAEQQFIGWYTPALVFAVYGLWRLAA